MEAKSVGLSFNADICKIMIVGCQDENDSDTLSVNVGNQLEVVDEFCCLGSFSASSGSCDMSIRIRNAGAVFARMCNIWKCKTFSTPPVRMRLYDYLVLTILICVSRF